ncbi:MAG: hypothetical protein Q9228_007906, partial [Teloschistes exilis]
MSEAYKASQVQDHLMQLELHELRMAQSAGKQKRGGVTVENMGTHMFSTEECLAKVVEAESSRRSKKGKARQPMVPEARTGPTEPNPFVLSNYNQEMH